MKNKDTFASLLDWHKFWKLSAYAFVILTVLYLLSLAGGDNVWPEYAWVVPGITAAWMVMLLLKTHSRFLELKFAKSAEKRKREFEERIRKIYNNG